VLFISDQLGLLVEAIETLVCLLEPFKWPFAYVPLLPVSLRDYLQVPTPYLIGGARSLRASAPKETLVVDLDKDALTGGGDPPTPFGSKTMPLPELLARRLLHGINIFKKEAMGAHLAQEEVAGDMFASPNPTPHQTPNNNNKQTLAQQKARATKRASTPSASSTTSSSSSFTRPSSFSLSADNKTDFGSFKSRGPLSARDEAKLLGMQARRRQRTRQTPGKGMRRASILTTNALHGSGVWLADGSDGLLTPRVKKTIAMMATAGVIDEGEEKEADGDGEVLCEAGIVMDCIENDAADAAADTAAVANDGGSFATPARVANTNSRASECKGPDIKALVQKLRIVFLDVFVSLLRGYRHYFTPMTTEALHAQRVSQDWDVSSLFGLDKFLAQHTSHKETLAQLSKTQIFWSFLEDRVLQMGDEPDDFDGRMLHVLEKSQEQREHCMSVALGGSVFRRSNSVMSVKFSAYFFQLVKMTLSMTKKTQTNNNKSKTIQITLLRGCTELALPEERESRSMKTILSTPPTQVGEACSCLYIPHAICTFIFVISFHLQHTHTHSTA
jgi:hypothetical protein